jgi:hypothetical protein
LGNPPARFLVKGDVAFMNQNHEQQQDHGRPGVSILVNQQQHFAPQAVMTGSELKTLAGIPAGNRLYLEAPGNQPDVPVADHVQIELKPGQHFYDLPPGIVGGEPGEDRAHPGGPGISILINGQHCFAPKEHMTGAELKALGGIPAGNRLYREEPGNHPDTAISDTQTIEVRPGNHYYDLPPGVVGGFLPIVQAQIDRAREEWPDLTATQQPGGNIAIEVPAVPTGPSWNMSTTPLLILLPPGYPESGRPSGFKVHPDLRQNNGNPAGGGSADYGGRRWLHLCWQPSQPWNERDTLWKHIKFAMRRFVEA